MSAVSRRLREDREGSALVEALLSFRAGHLVSWRLRTLLGFLQPTASSLKCIIKKIPKSLLRVSSLWFVIALIVLMAFEITSASGHILERFGADIVAGWIGQLVLLSLLIDSLRGTLPRAAMLIPIVFYLSYYS